MGLEQDTYKMDGSPIWGRETAQSNVGRGNRIGDVDRSVKDMRQRGGQPRQATEWEHGEADI
jgi:hypothetical protein